MAHITFERFRSLSNATYICLFGACFGALFFGVANPTAIRYLWLVMGALGIVLAIIKDTSVGLVCVRAGLLLADALTIVALLLLYRHASSLPRPGARPDHPHTGSGAWSNLFPLALQ